ncbi:hypothetical protein PS1_044676 [Malus domestica]
MQLKGRESWLHSILLSHYNPRQYRAARGSSGELQELHLVSKEEEIEKIKRCPEQDSCDCRSHFHLHKLPLSNRFSLG